MNNGANPWIPARERGSAGADDLGHGLRGVGGGELLAQVTDDGTLGRGEQLLLVAGARGDHVHGGHDALAGTLGAEHQLEVGGTCQLLEEELVGGRAGADGHGRQDRQRAAVLHRASGPEELLRRVDGGGVDETGEDASVGRRGEVVGTPEAGERVEQHDHVVAELDEPLRALDGQLGDQGVVGRLPVEGRGDDLALDGALVVGDLLRARVDEDHHDVALGVVGGDRLGDRLQQRGGPGPRRSQDQPSLALAHRGGDVHDAPDQVGVRGQAQPLVRVDRDRVGELRTLLGTLGLGAVDAVDTDHRVELLPTLPLPRLAHLADHGVTAAEVVLADHRQRQVDVLWTGQVARRAHERAVVEHVEDPRGRHQDVVLEDRGVGLVAAAAARTDRRAVASATAAVAAAAALAVLVVVPRVLVLPVLVLPALVLLRLLALVAVLTVLVAVLPVLVLLGLALLALLVLLALLLVLLLVLLAVRLLLVLLLGPRVGLLLSGLLLSGLLRGLLDLLVG